MERVRIAEESDSLTQNKCRTRSFLDFVASVRADYETGKVSFEMAHALIERFLIMQGENETKTNHKMSALWADSKSACGDR